MLKIALIGPESTGKSDLSVALASHFKARFIPEYARTYVEQLHREYQYEDVVCIAQKQIDEQQTVLSDNNSDIVFFDTELIITKVWFEYCYQKVPPFVESRIREKYFDFYLLCYPDLPWIADPVREHGGDERVFLYNLYKDELDQLGASYFEIKGVGSARTKMAIDIVNRFLERNF